MIWYLCLTLAFVLLLLTFFYAFNSKQRRLDYSFALLMCAGFLSYFPHYIANYDILNAVLCDVVNLFQVVTLNSNTYETYQPEITNPFWFYICILIRGTLHVTSPVLGTVAAYNFIRIQMEKWKSKSICRKKDNIYIFSSFNEKAVKIAESIADSPDVNHKKVAFIFYDAEKTDIDLEEKLGYKGVAHIGRKMKMDVEISKLPDLDLSRQNVFYFLLEESDENLNIGIMLNNYYNELIKDSGQSTDSLMNLHITLFSGNPIEDENIIDSIPTNIDLRVINEKRIFVYNLLNDLPLYKVPDKDISVLITGFKDIGREFLFAALALGQMPERKIKFNILCENSQKEINYLNFYYPEILCNYDIEFHETDPDSNELFENVKNYASDANYIVVCRDNDSDNIKTAVMLRKYYLKDLSDNNDFSNMPVIALYISKDAKAYTVKKSVYDLFPFGYENQIYSYDEMVESEMESLAKRVHFAYCGDDGSLKEKVKGYYKYERNRKSNLAMALSIKYKLHMMGFDISLEKGKNDDKDELIYYLENSDLDDISEAEHRRWMTYMRTEGYTQLTAEQGAQLLRSPYADIINNKPGQSIYMSMHMDICDMDKITPYTIEFNDLMRKYELDAVKKDTTNTDKYIIQRIPDIISNEEWNSEARLKKYYIKKL